MIRSRPDRQFERFRRTGDPRALAKVFDATAPELWRVAVHLCRDRHGAEDAVQSTFLSAIEARTEWDAARPLLPWLLGHLANRVREQRRVAARAFDAARLERGGERDPADVACTNELGAVCRDAIARLDEPYRSTLERHLLHGEAAHEIASGLGIAPGTVRMRLHRGLEQLRQTLPAGVVAGSAIAAHVPTASLVAMREAVLASLPGGAAAVGAGHVGSIAMGVLLMNKTIQGVAVSAVVVASMWLVWPAASESPATNALAVVAPAASATDANATPRATGEPGGAAAAPADMERTAVAPTPAADAKGVVRFVVRNAATGAAIAGVQLELLDGLQREPVFRDGTATSTSREDEERSFRARTGADGTVIVELRSGFTSVQCLGMDVRRSVEVTPGAMIEHRIDLPVRLAADVRVVDAEGRPVSGARLVGTTDLDPSGLAARELGRSDAAGRFAAPFVETKVTLRAVHDAFAASAAVELDARRPTATLRLGEAPATIAGTVFDPDGAPLAGSLVALQPQPRSRSDAAPLVAKTDEHGRFECTNVPPGRCFVVASRLLDAGQSRLAAIEVDAVANERRVVEVRFDDGGGLDVHLARADGTPIADTTVMVWLQQECFSPPLARRGAAHLQTDTGGRGAVRGLLPGRYQVQFAHEHGLVREFVDVARGEVTRYQHVVGGRPGLEVRVLDMAGAPLVGWKVGITNGTEGRVETTDRDGRVRFVDLREETWHLTVRRDNSTAVAGTRDVLPGSNVEMRVDADPVGDATVRGVLEATRGIALREVQAALMPRTAQPDRVPAPIFATIDAATGTFAMQHVPAGVYGFQVMGPGALPLAIRDGVEVAASGTVDLGRIVLATGTLVVRATFTEGRVCEPLHVAVRMGSQQVFVEPNANRDGGVELPEAHFDVLAWGATCAPVFTAADVRNGATIDVPVTATRAAAVTMAFGGLPEGVEIGLLTVRRAGQEVLRIAVSTREPLVRGFAPGDHELEFDDLRGHRFAAKFTIGADLAAREVTLQPQ